MRITASGGRHAAILGALALAGLTGCARANPPESGDGAVDAASGPDAAHDAGIDAIAPDAGPDAAVDAAVDAAADAGADAGPCVPDCTDADCGPDGCGGSCGTCPGEQLCSQSRTCVGVLYPASGREKGVDYHATGADFENDAFLTVYDQAGVRATVQTQLAGLAAAGATVVSTRIWLVVEPGATPVETWKHHFPLTAGEVQNIRLYAQDVAGAGLKLYLTFLYLWCAQYTEGDPTTVLGHCALSATTFGDRVRQSVGDVLDAVRDVYAADGRPVVERVFLDGEVMTAAGAADSATQWEKPNQRWFLSSSGLWQWFWDAVRAAGLIPSLYFIHGTGEAEILGGGYSDADFAALDGHRAMYWIYRTLRFLVDNSLPVPDRIDFSSYPAPEHTNHATLFNRVFGDFEAVVPPLLGVAAIDCFVAETFYHTAAGTRQRAHKGLAAQFTLRPHLRGVTFWTTPDAGGAGDHAGYPFDLTALDDGDISVPTFGNPSFETDGACGTGDSVANPAGFCTEWPNGNVTSWHIGRSSAAAHDGAYAMEAFFGACATQPCQDSAYPGIYVLSDAASGAAPGWSLARFWARYDGTDNAAGAVLIDDGSTNADYLDLLQSSSFVEYVLLGPVTSTSVTLRLQISDPQQQSTTAVFDLLH